MKKEELKKLREETIKKLEEVKNNLGYDTEENYCNIINIMIDYDNEADDDLYLSDNCRESINVLDEDLLPDYIEWNKGLERLFYATRGLEYADSIYRIDAYGNLQNIEESDFIYTIDEAIESLQDAMKEEV